MYYYYPLSRTRGNFFKTKKKKKKKESRVAVYARKGDLQFHYINSVVAFAMTNKKYTITIYLILDTYMIRNLILDTHMISKHFIL